jgi:TonB family protein
VVQSGVCLRATLEEVIVRIQGAAHRTNPRGLLARALPVSVTVHALFVAILLFPWWRAEHLDAWRSSSAQTEISAVGEFTLPSWVDLLSASEVLGDLSQVAPPITEGEYSQDTAKSAHNGIAVVVREPAPDEGTGTGKRGLPAFRLDRSTSHQRLSNGARLYQPEHERMARTASSTQAERREPTVGISELSRTQKPRSTEGLALPRRQAGEDASTLAETGDGARQKTSGTGEILGQGPLDAEQGERRFDVDRKGPAQDSRWAKSLSGELHPSRMDLSATSSPGPPDGIPGRGPGQDPGAIPKSSRGIAPSIHGNHGLAMAGGEGDAAVTRARHELEIGRRIHRFLRFPQHLALMLEQGETIVTFVVAADGRIDGRVVVVKSAGFAEFDDEAVSAVQRAAPFAPPGCALAFSVRIPFQNPVVR